MMHLIIIVLIGIAAGLLFHQYGRGWLARQTSSATGLGSVTCALVGIAGSFIGFHLGVISGLLPTPLMLYLAAIAGAAITIWLWRER